LLYMASLEIDGNPVYPWAGTMSTITASFTAIVQFGSMVVAAYYLEQTADKRAADVEALPIDEEVKEADDKADRIRQCYKEATQWDTAPFFAKMFMRISLSCIIVSSYMVQLFSSRCFTTHSLTDSIDDNLNGNAANLFLPLGWVAVGLFCTSCLFLYLFQQWGKVSQLHSNTSVTETAQSTHRLTKLFLLLLQQKAIQLAHGDMVLEDTSPHQRRQSSSHVQIHRQQSLDRGRRSPNSEGVISSNF
jgi:hypothetical protein